MRVGDYGSDRTERVVQGIITTGRRRPALREVVDPRADERIRSGDSLKVYTKGPHIGKMEGYTNSLR